MHDLPHAEGHVARGRAEVGRRLAVAALVGTLAPPIGVARAEHDMAMSDPHHAGMSEVSVGLAFEAADFDTTSYVGDYQGVTPSLSYMRGWFGASAAISLYHLNENGLSLSGPGDTMLAVHADVLDGQIAGAPAQAGIAVHLMLPTGSEIDNLGMGHVMVMPAVWGAWHVDAVTLAATAGYGRALTSMDGAQHNHGPAPLVDPMNMQEVTWSAAADVDVSHGLQVGARTQGAAPVGTGRLRWTGGGRVGWGNPRVSTGLELQVGLAGDPFTVRGVLDTALRF
jgi:hypothetical protein